MKTIHPSISLFLLLVLFATLALATKDPELKQCRHQCRAQRQYTEEDKEQCLKECKRYYQEKKQRERERGDVDEPEERLTECQKLCEKHVGGEQRALCRFRCQERYRGRQGSDVNEWNYEDREVEEEEEEEEERRGTERDENPYVFEPRHFSTRAKTQHGRIDVLEKFNKKHKLLRGLKYYRVGVLEADPLTFVSPSHWDADGVLYVARGKGTITQIIEGKRESYNIEAGDVIRVRAGTPVYLINRDEIEKLNIVKFLQPVNNPGEYEAFLPAGGEESESFYTAFSWEVLEAALQVDRERLQRILQRSQGVIVKATREQIQALSGRDHEEGGKIWPFTGDSNRPFNLINKGPTQSNNYGQLFEPKENDFKQQLKDLDLTVTVANITKGSMTGPYYNSKATKISVVLDGNGRLEMACPHIASQHKEGRRGSRRGSGTPTYHKVRAQLRRGTVFVAPAGHPIATIASDDNNLVILCFEVNWQGNTRYTLAGRGNIVNEWEREAKELAFGVRAREVEQVFNKQNEELFFPGPSRQHGRERRAVE